MADLVECMKIAALGAVEASKPPRIDVGTVTAVDPLKIAIDQRFPLAREQLILTRNVTDYTVETTVDCFTEHDTGSNPHRHALTGKKTVTVHNGLMEGDKVVLIRVQGGQKYLVADRVT